MSILIGGATGILVVLASLFIHDYRLRRKESLEMEQLDQSIELEKRVN